MYFIMFINKYEFIRYLLIFQNVTKVYFFCQYKYLFKTVNPGSFNPELT